ncbi:NDR1/HIN1-like protein 3 [Rutidosis leptorrhynchoides]|uniref:NDR1/HIN1-like protein 3 n=1 Tax=Rutidosis leptorrhynchoides TaxID=125765 RepID=UPI003A9A01D0
MVIVGFCLFLVWSFLNVSFQVIRESTIPQVEVDDVNLTGFMLSPTNNTLYYDVAANMTFKNPYSKVGIQFDKIDADLMYQGQRLGTKVMLDVFYLPPNKEKSNVNVILRGEHVLQLINGDEKLVYASENKSGVYKIGLKVRIVTSFMWLNLNSGRTTVEIMCDNLQILSSMGMFGMRACGSL